MSDPAGERDVNDLSHRVGEFLISYPAEEVTDCLVLNCHLPSPLNPEKSETGARSEPIWKLGLEGSGHARGCIRQAPGLPSSLDAHLRSQRVKYNLS